MKSKYTIVVFVLLTALLFLGFWKYGKMPSASSAAQPPVPEQKQKIIPESHQAAFSEIAAEDEAINNETKTIPKDILEKVINLQGRLQRNRQREYTLELEARRLVDVPQPQDKLWVREKVKIQDKDLWAYNFKLPAVAASPAPVASATVATPTPAPK